MTVRQPSYSKSSSSTGDPAPMLAWVCIESVKRKAFINFSKVHFKLKPWQLKRNLSKRPRQIRWCSLHYYFSRIEGGRRTEQNRQTKQHWQDQDYSDYSQRQSVAEKLTAFFKLTKFNYCQAPSQNPNPLSPAPTQSNPVNSVPRGLGLTLKSWATPPPPTTFRSLVWD